MYVTVMTEKHFNRVFEIVNNGYEVAPRGHLTKEVLGLSMTIYPRVRFVPFEARAISLPYIKKEWQWYVKGDPKDLSIVASAAGVWGPMVKDGRLNSNYGSYWFTSDHGVRYVLRELARDPMSRRAVIPMYGTMPEHFDDDVKDVPCTTQIQFFIRLGTLHTHVNMRSQDVVLGMCNDVPAFSFLAETVSILAGTRLGPLHVNIGSAHVYERHFDAVAEMAKESPAVLNYDPAPRMTVADATAHINHQIADTEFGQWILQSSL
jgi:thymidylate synthase